MSLRSVPDRNTILSALAAMADPVRVQFFTQTVDCETCVPARQILDDIATSSDRITIEEHNFLLDKGRVAEYRIEHVPSLAIVGATDPGIRFAGAPLGYEFASLVEAIVMVSRGESDLSDESRALIATVNEPVRIRVFVTPTCVHCPRAVSLAHRMALESPHIVAEAVQATQFPDLVRRYRVNGVPKTIVNDRVEILGSLPEEMFVRKALEGLIPSVV